MDAAIEVRELRRHEVEEAVEFGRPLGAEVSVEAVSWTVSLTARREGAWLGVALVAPDALGTPRVWVAVVEDVADRGGLICRLMDKAMLKLRSVAVGACAVTVCGADGESMVNRAHWCVGGEPGGPDEATAPLRALDEVVAEAGEAETDEAESGEAGANSATGDGTGTAQAA